ncbi:hypothetical protein CPB83DRAFT_692447 [Crepidotus variabilis]|uniref:Uncharacterized protein n=1 Tax=Crepidotus variabilis TaxID=179855 RepID=A0A9P6JJK7_9AGAR|nr:hypothetical protein CPB83DRAFT_692447 [Crepidotus variabilis]
MTGSGSKSMIANQAEPRSLQVPIRLHTFEIHNFHFSSFSELFNIKRQRGLPAVDLLALEIVNIYNLPRANQILPFLVERGACNTKHLVLRNLNRPAGLCKVLMSIQLEGTLRCIDLCLGGVLLDHVHDLLKEFTALSAPSVENQVEEIHITIRFSSLTRAGEVYGGGDFIGLAALLATRKAWPSLQSVYLRIIHDFHLSPESTATWQRSPEEQLRLFWSARLLRHYHGAHVLFREAIQGLLNH